MRIFTSLILLWAFAVACGADTTPTPTRIPPSAAPIPLAQTTNAPTAPSSNNAAATPTLPSLATLPPATLAGTPTERPSATLLPPTTLAPTQKQAPSAPAILTEFRLFDLPGEGRGPVALAQLGGTLYVVNRSSGNVAVVEDDKVTGFVDVGPSPTSIVADPTRQRVYVGTYETPTIAALADGRVTKQITPGGRVNSLALDGDDLYVALDNDAVIERYDASTLVKRDELKLSQGFGVSDLQLDPARKRLYAAIYGKIVALDLETFQELFTLEVPSLYAQFAVNPADGSIWAGGYDSATSRAYVIGFKPDGQQLAKVFLDGEPEAAAFDDANQLYALDRYNNRVYVLRAPEGQLVATIDVNESPSAALYDANGKRLVVANQDNDNLSLIDLKAQAVARTIPLASAIMALAANEATGRVYAASGTTNAVLALEDNKVVGEVETGKFPVDLAVDPTTNRVYAASQADGRLTVFDGTTLKIEGSEYITRALSTVAVDPLNQRLFAGSQELDPQTLKPLTTLYARGVALDSKVPLQFERINPALKKLYAFASNAIPGSNSRLTLYRFRYEDLGESKMLGTKNGGNTSAMAIDAATNKLYVTNTHPLAYTHGLDVFDGDDQLVQSLALPAHTTALAVNPDTNHLFVAHARTFSPAAGGLSAKDDSIEVLDTRTLGRVASLPVKDAWRMTRLGNKVYAVSYADGKVTVLGDAATAQPPAPTPTLTVTPYPTWTPAPTRAPVGTATASAASSGTSKCATAPAKAFVNAFGRHAAALGCPTGPVQPAKFAVQTFRDGYMFDDLRDPQAQRIYALFPDGSYRVFDDTWKEGEDARPCNDIPVPDGRFHPERGFGKVWCENVEVQAKLPGAVADETGVALQLQPFEHGMIWGNTPKGVMVLTNSGAWYLSE